MYCMLVLLIHINDPKDTKCSLQLHSYYNLKPNVLVLGGKIKIPWVRG